MRPTREAEAAVVGNDEGVSLQAKPSCKQSPWDQQGNPLRDGTHVTPAASLQISPDFARAGGEVSFSPAAIFEVRAHALMTRYFGNLGPWPVLRRPRLPAAPMIGATRKCRVEAQ